MRSPVILILVMITERRGLAQLKLAEGWSRGTCANNRDNYAFSLVYADICYESKWVSSLELLSYSSSSLPPPQFNALLQRTTPPLFLSCRFFFSVRRGGVRREEQGQDKSFALGWWGRGRAHPSFKEFGWMSDLCAFAGCSLIFSPLLLNHNQFSPS